MANPAPEPWLRGPVPEISAMLQPVAHAFLGADEDLRAAMSDLSQDQLWRRVGDAASLGFHLMHLAGSTDRLMTYARGEALSDQQMAALARERRAEEERPSVEDLLSDWAAVLEATFLQLSTTDDGTLTEARFVGRARLPSTVLGLLFHAAEHASRHAGQAATTAKILRNTPEVA